MITIDVRADFAGALGALDNLQRDVRDTVIARSLNRIAEQTKTQASREIGNRYNLTRAQVRNRIIIDKAFAKTRLTVVVRVPLRGGKYRALHLTNLTGTKDLRYSIGRVGAYTLRMARRTSKGKVTSKGGVQYSILRGNRQIFPNAFIAPGKNSGKLIAFQRTDLDNPRSKLKALHVIDVPQMFNARVINDSLLRLIRDKFPREVEAQMRFATARFNR